MRTIMRNPVGRPELFNKVSRGPRNELTGELMGIKKLAGGLNERVKPLEETVKLLMERVERLENPVEVKGDSVAVKRGRPRKTE